MIKLTSTIFILSLSTISFCQEQNENVNVNTSNNIETKSNNQSSSENKGLMSLPKAEKKTIVREENINHSSEIIE